MYTYMRIFVWDMSSCSLYDSLNLWHFFLWHFFFKKNMLSAGSYLLFFNWDRHWRVDSLPCDIKMTDRVRETTDRVRDTFKRDKMWDHQIYLRQAQKGQFVSSLRSPAALPSWCSPFRPWPPANIFKWWGRNFGWLKQRSMDEAHMCEKKLKIKPSSSVFLMFSFSALATCTRYWIITRDIYQKCPDAFKESY